MVRPNEQSIKVHDVLREVEAVAPAICYLYEEQIGAIGNKPPKDTQTFVFQYWPENVSDTYSPNYNEVSIPGGSHPLYQYVGGSERAIGFEATFTAEVKVNDQLNDLLNADAQKYSVDVVAAMARLQRYLYPSYLAKGQLGVVRAPPRLVLVMPKTNLGRDKDEVLVILRAASVSYTHWFPDGTPRVATVSLEFAESVQTRGQGKGPQVKFIGSAAYENFSKKYQLGLFKSTRR